MLMESKNCNENLKNFEKKPEIIGKGTKEDQVDFNDLG